MNDSNDVPIDNAEAKRAIRTRMALTTACVLLLWTALADYLIYRTYGFSGPAVFFALVPVFFLLRPRENDDGQPKSSSLRIAKTICVALLWCAAIRLALIGNGLVVFSATLLTFALALASSNVFPWALETIAMSARSLVDGLLWLGRHRLPSIGRRATDGNSVARTMAWLFPGVATIVFGGIFVLANPDLQEIVSARLELISDWTWQWVSRLDGLEIPFCVTALLLGAGLLFPTLGKLQIGGTDTPIDEGDTTKSPLYGAFRNTLVCLIVLFSVYLVFEFKTLWSREFEEGFYYAGYAHQGAAWLTAALALATSLLSIIFHGKMLSDPRVTRLKSLAWVWSTLNFLLAVAVFNRLAIYVGYNGLTVMRLFGFFGITVVVVGFSLVLIKIATQKGFWWLVRTQLTALMFFIIAFTLFPVDYVAHRYNVSRVVQNDLTPAVMIAVKPKDDLGYLPLLDLVNVSDPVIRKGVRAMLADRQIAIKAQVDSAPWHWTRFQGAAEMLYPRLVEMEGLWSLYLDDSDKRDEAISRFQDYAMQWY